MGDQLHMHIDISARLNEELEKKGYLTIKGRVVSTYFYERFFGKDDETKDSKYIRIQR